MIVIIADIAAMSSGRMSHVGPGPRMGKVTKKDTYGGDGNNEEGIKSSGGETELPLEKRFVDFKSDSGVVTKLAALVSFVSRSEIRAKIRNISWA
jgi:hypothetical protein